MSLKKLNELYKQSPNKRAQIDEEAKKLIKKINQQCYFCGVKSTQKVSNFAGKLIPICQTCLISFNEKEAERQAKIKHQQQKDLEALRLLGLKI